MAAARPQSLSFHSSIWQRQEFLTRKEAPRIPFPVRIRAVISPELSRKEQHRARKKLQWKVARRARKEAEVKKGIAGQLQRIHEELKKELGLQKSNELKGRIKALLKQIREAGLQGSFQGLENIDISKVGQGMVPREPPKDVWLERRRAGSRNVWVRSGGEGEEEKEGRLEVGTWGRDDKSDARIGVRMGRSGFLFAKMEYNGRQVVDYEPIVERERRPVDEKDQVMWLAHSLNAARLQMSPLHLSRLMHSGRLKLTDGRLLELVRMLGELGNWRRAMQVVDWVYARQHSRYSKSRYVLTMLLAVLGRARRPVEAVRVFNTMRECPSAYPDMAAYHSIAVTLGQSGCVRELLAVIDDLRKGPDARMLRQGFLHNEGRLEPDVVVYNAVINACVDNAEWKGVQWVMSQMSKERVDPNSATFGLAIEVMVKAGQVDQALDMYSRMEHGNFHPNFLTIRALVQACGSVGNADLAVELVEDVKQRGMVAGASLYYTLACTLCKAGRWREALTQIDKTKGLSSRKPDVITFTGLIRACEEAGLWQDAIDLFDHMRTFCAPNIGTFNIMIGVYGKNKHFRAALALYEGMCKGVFSQPKPHKKEPRLSPDDFTYEAILGACVRSDKWEEFAKLYQVARLHGFQLRSSRHTWLVTLLSRAGKVDLVESILAHLQESKQIPSVQIYQQQLWAHHRLGESQRLLLLLKQMSSHGIALNRLEWNVVLGQQEKPLTLAQVGEFISKLHKVGKCEDHELIQEVKTVLLSAVAGCSEPNHGMASSPLCSTDFPSEQEPDKLWCDGLHLFKQGNPS